MKRLMYTRPDGGVNIVIPAPKADIEKVLGPLTDAEYEAHVKARSLPKDATNVKSISDGDLPDDRTYRNAWVLDNSTDKVDLHLDKVKEIVLTELREKRNRLLVEADGEYNRAVETEDTKKAAKLKSYKQKLRDVTEDLKAIDPEGAIGDKTILANIESATKIPKKP